MKQYTYKGFYFYKTSVICANNGQCLYAIYDDSTGDVVKPAGKRPFCTSIANCKEWINKKIDGELFY